MTAGKTGRELPRRRVVAEMRDPKGGRQERGVAPGAPGVEAGASAPGTPTPEMRSAETGSAVARSALTRPPETAFERELRLVLRYGTPDLGAPVDRMRHVRRRVVRRRRRLALLTAVTSVAAAVGLVGALHASGALGPLRTREPVPGLPMAADVPRPRTTAPVADDLGLVLWTPPGWRTLTQPDATSLVTVFVANRPMEPTDRCETPTVGGFTCAPVAALADGEVLIAFRQEDPGPRAGERRTFTVRVLDRPDAGCRALGGDRQLMGWGSVPAQVHDRPAINAYACLRGASEKTRATVGKLLTTAGRVGTPVLDDGSTVRPRAGGAPPAGARALGSLSSGAQLSGPEFAGPQLSGSLSSGSRSSGSPASGLSAE